MQTGMDPVCIFAFRVFCYLIAGRGALLRPTNRFRVSPPGNRAVAKAHRRVLRYPPAPSLRRDRREGYRDGVWARLQRFEIHVGRRLVGPSLLQACEFCSSFTMNSSLGDKGGNPGYSARRQRRAFSNRLSDYISIAVLCAAERQERNSRRGARARAGSGQKDTNRELLRLAAVRYRLFSNEGVICVRLRSRRGTLHSHVRRQLRQDARRSRDRRNRGTTEPRK